jgi:hypothetical protein
MGPFLSNNKWILIFEDEFTVEGSLSPHTVISILHVSTGLVTELSRSHRIVVDFVLVCHQQQLMRNAQKQWEYLDVIGLVD